MSANGLLINEEWLREELNDRLINELDLKAAHKQILKKCLKERNPAQIEDMGIGMIGFKQPKTFSKAMSHFMGGGNNNRKIFNAIKCEFFKFLCTDSPAYATERKGLVYGLKQLIHLLAIKIVASLGLVVLTLQELTGVITNLLILILKMGKNAWCSANSNLCIR